MKYSVKEVYTSCSRITLTLYALVQPQSRYLRESLFLGNITCLCVRLVRYRYLVGDTWAFVPNEGIGPSTFVESLRMPNPTADWERVGDRFYRKVKLYDAVFDQDLELENYIIAGAPYGGAIGNLLLSKNVD